MKITLTNRRIPRNQSGDPSFTSLDDVLTVFTPSETTELVNRCLYQLEYQQKAHLKRARELTERLKPIREYLRKHFNITYDKATDEQIREATEKTKN